MSKKKESGCKFQKKELVNAKIRGYPWWPGVIGKVTLKSHENGEKKYEILVNFIGDDSHSIVSEDKLQKFIKKEVDFKKKKRKKLNESLQIANDIYDGLYTYEEWQQQARLKNKFSKKASKKQNETEDDENDEGEEEEDEQETSSVSSVAESENSLIQNEDEGVNESNDVGQAAVEEADDQQSDEGEGEDEEEGDSEIEGDHSDYETESNQKQVPASKGKVKSRTANQRKPPQQKKTKQIKKTSTKQGQSKQSKAIAKVSKNEEIAELPVKPAKQSLEGVSSKDLPSLFHHFSVEQPTSNDSTTCPVLSKTRSTDDHNTRSHSQIKPVPPQPTHEIRTAIPDNKNPKIVIEPIDEEGDEQQDILNRSNTTTRAQQSNSSKNEGINAQKQQICGEDDENNNLNVSPSILKKAISKKAKETADNSLKSIALKNKKSDSAQSISDLNFLSIDSQLSQQLGLFSSDIGSSVQSVNGTKAQSIELELNEEFKQLFSTLLDSTPEGLKKLQQIISKINKQKPDPDNILEILNNENGKKLVQARQLIFESASSTKQTKSVASSMASLKQELDTLISLLQSNLLKKFFECTETKNSEEQQKAPVQAHPQSVSPAPKKGQKATKANSSLENSPSELDDRQPEIDPLKNLSEEQKTLRRKICLKIIKPLQRILKEQAIVQTLAKNIEGMLRTNDASMGPDYKANCRQFITLITKNEFTTTVQHVKDYIDGGCPTKLYLLTGSKDSQSMNLNAALMVSEEEQDQQHLSHMNDGISEEEIIPKECK